MKRGLRKRLAFTQVAVAALAIAVVGVIVAYTGSQRFEHYLEQARELRTAAVVATLESTYRPPDGWDATAIFALSQVAKSAAVDIAVYDLDGRLVFTIEGEGANGSGSAAAGGDGGASPAPGATPLGPADFVVRSASVVVDGRQVGRAEIFTAADARTAADGDYERALTRDLVVAVVVAGALAFVVSLLVSRRLTGPLEELTDAAVDVVNGDLLTRVAPRGDDEVAALASAFNSMADRLARDEQWRRDMTGDLSDEVRAPLAAIQARVAALEGGSAPPTPEDLRAIGAEVERLDGLLGALRSLNELESEELSVEHEPLDLAEVVRGVVERRRPEFVAGDVALTADLQPAVVLGDREHLRRMTELLLENALKFTPSGGDVAVAVAPDGPDAAPDALHAGAVTGPSGAAVRLTVSDDGPGVDATDLPFVFDRFYRAAGVRGTPGAGLGLALCRALVEAHGGAVAAGEAPGGGARFTVLLPAAPG